MKYRSSTSPVEPSTSLANADRGFSNSSNDGMANKLMPMKNKAPPMSPAYTKNHAHRMIFRYNGARVCCKIAF